jgi:hypothetical protein
MNNVFTDSESGVGIGYSVHVCTLAKNIISKYTMRTVHVCMHVCIYVCKWPLFQLNPFSHGDR